MKLLITGASGHVGTLVIPFLKQHHTLRIFDLRPPADSSVEYCAGSVTDFDALLRAAEGMDALLYMAMNLQKGPEMEIVQTSFDVNVKGVYLALRAARERGIGHAVYTSSMSVYDGNLDARYFFDEDMPPDARGLYGLTKRMGEEVCRNAHQLYGMSVNVLRLFYPLSREKWLAQAVPGKPSGATDAEDVARAMLAALEYRNGFQAFMISGDYENKITNMSKARRLLGWEPLARPQGANPTSPPAGG
jgi:nucleoside-diphosphate-sugar epimerase